MVISSVEIYSVPMPQTSQTKYPARIPYNIVAVHKGWDNFKKTLFGSRFDIFTIPFTGMIAIIHTT